MRPGEIHQLKRLTVARSADDSIIAPSASYNNALGPRSALSPSKDPVSAMDALTAQEIGHPARPLVYLREHLRRDAQSSAIPCSAVSSLSRANTSK